MFLARSTRERARGRTVEVRSLLRRSRHERQTGGRRRAPDFVEREHGLVRDHAVGDEHRDAALRLELWCERSQHRRELLLPPADAALRTQRLEVAPRADLAAFERARIEPK